MRVHDLHEENGWWIFRLREPASWDALCLIVPKEGRQWRGSNTYAVVRDKYDEMLGQAFEGFRSDAERIKSQGRLL